MGRKEQDARKRKAAAKLCSPITLWAKKISISGNDSSPISITPTEENSPELSTRNDTDIITPTEENPPESSTCVADDQDSVVPSTFQDIGHILKNKCHEEIVEHLHTMSTADKYNVIFHHFVPDAIFKFPERICHQNKRKFQLNYLKEFSWMVYSPSADGAYCIACAVLLSGGDRCGKGQFVNFPFTSFHKIKEKAKEHQNTKYHMQCMVAVDKIKQPENSISCLLDTNRRQNIESNRKILKCIVQAALFCAKQCIGLRADGELQEFGTFTKNSGNFLAALHLIASHNKLLHDHLSNIGISHKNAKYTSPHVQNEIISIIGHDIISRDIVNEVMAAKVFSIMADEVTSHNTEELSLCVRFVDKNNIIREEFLEFIKLARITGEAIANEIVEKLKALGLNLEGMRGQTYDGAANMSSNNIGVQRRIKHIAPKAVYVHCASHCLNLVIAHSCKLPDVRNMIDKLKMCCIFFKNSPKREGLLCSIIANKVSDSSRRKGLIDLCQTRWSARHNAYEHFFQTFPHIVTALEFMAYGVNSDDAVGDDFAGASWDSKTTADAASMLSSLTNFQFMISFMIVYQLLSHLNGITQKLQGRTVDIIYAYQEVGELSLINEMKKLFLYFSSNVDDEFPKIYHEAVGMAWKINVEPSIPRIAGRQTHRSNAPSSSIEGYFKINLAIPFLNHINNELDAQFSELSTLAVNLLGLIPAVLHGDNPPSLEDSLEFYKEDLPSPETFNQELLRWKLKFEGKAESVSTAAQALTECNEMIFPNISQLLKICATIPVTSCECERSASCLRRLHNYNRASMTQTRLSALALTHIHYDRVICLDTVCELYAKKHPRRMAFSSPLL